MSVSRTTLPGAITIAAVIGAAPAWAIPPEVDHHNISSVATISFYDTYQLKNPPVGSLLSGILSDNRHNSPAVQLGSLDLGWKSDNGRLSLRGSFIVGDVADELHGGAGGYGALHGEARYRNIGQAYGTLQLGERGAIDFGKFYSEIGQERPEPWKNNFLSNSNLYAELLPKYHAGVRVDYPIGTGSASNLSAQVGLVQALFNSPEFGVRSNKGNVDGYAGLRYRGGDPMGAHWSGSAHYGWGDQKVGSIKQDVSLIDVGLNYNFKSGALGTFEYAHSRFKDSEVDKFDGFVLSYGQPLGGGIGRLRYDNIKANFDGDTDRRSSVALDFERPLCENALWRTEVRHDMSSTPFFLNGSGNATRKSQDVISTGVFFSTDSMKGMGGGSMVFPKGDQFHIDGGFAGYFSYDTNTPENGLIGARTFDTLHSTPTINLAELNVGIPAKTGGFGFQSSWITGDIANQMHLAYSNRSDGEARFKNIGQLYGAYAWDGGTARLGKFYSPFGQERIEPWKNPFTSTSNLFIELPRYHFGIDATYQVPSTDNKVQVRAALVNSLVNTPNYGVKPHNGYNSWLVGVGYNDNRDGKDEEEMGDAFGDDDWYQPTHLRGRVLYGSGRNPESGYMNTRIRTDLLDVQGDYGLGEKRGIVAEYLRRTDRPSGSARTTTDGWSATYCHPLGEGTLRGRIDGLQNKFGSNTDRITSFTLGYERPFCERFAVRPEIRLDTANEAIFSRSREVGTSTKKNQLTLTVGAFYKFSK